MGRWRTGGTNGDDEAIAQDDHYGEERFLIWITLVWTALIAAALRAGQALVIVVHAVLFIGMTYAGMDYVLRNKSRNWGALLTISILTVVTLVYIVVDAIRILNSDSSDSKGSINEA